MIKDWTEIVDDILDQVAVKQQSEKAVKRRILQDNLPPVVSDAENLATLSELTRNLFGEDSDSTRLQKVASLLSIIVSMSKALSERVEKLARLADEAGLGEPCR